MQPDSITLKCADGYPLSATVINANPARGAVVIAPALGVPRRFYAAYASYLASQGFSVLCFDYRGSGDSVKGPIPGRDMRMADWGQQDIEAALSWVRRELKPSGLFLVGHSAGAQLPGLAPSAVTLDGMILVAGSAPHLRHYPLRSWPMLMLTWYVLGPILSLGRDDFPARRTGLGSTTVAAGVVAQWSQWARSRHYLFDTRHKINTSGYARLKMPLLSYCFADDSYATEQATNALLERYPATQIERRVVPVSTNGSIGHFGFFREQQKDLLWRESAEWLSAHTGGK